jgi:hypothetical protein
MAELRRSTYGSQWVIERLISPGITVSISHRRDMSRSTAFPNPPYSHHVRGASLEGKLVFKVPLPRSDNHDDRHVVASGGQR